MNKINSEIVVGFLQESTECYTYHRDSQPSININYSLCNNITRDTLLLITKIRGARKSVDLGLALSPHSEAICYKPYKSAGFKIFCQKGKSLNERLMGIFHNVFNMGYKRIIIMAHGVPNLPISYIENALFHLRNNNDMVIGPLKNGLFYIIGVNRKLYENHILENVLKDIDLKDHNKVESVLTKIKNYHINCYSLPEWYILKSINDIKKFKSDTFNGIGYTAKWTQQTINKLLS